MPFAAVDPAAFDIILDNLLDNAASFAASRVRVVVSQAEGGRAIEIAIEDDGPGIPPEHLGRVFDRFFTWRPGEEKGRHTGLGLSLALALARSLGGTIEAGNCAGNRQAGEAAGADRGPEAKGEIGARFLLRLPAATR